MKFEKVSLKQFEKDCDAIGLRFENIQKVYDDIKLPRRSTSGSAGYDFFAPFDMQIVSDGYRQRRVPTGIKAKIDPGWVLTLHTRSGQAINYGIQLKNNVGIIDADYYNNIGNEGHIQAALVMLNLEWNLWKCEKGSAFMQGIFLPYGLTDDDKATGTRIGGFGSTTEV